jgi:hypothetical protein
MQFVPTYSYSPAHAKTALEKNCSLPLSTFICFIFADQGLDLVGEQTADRSLPTGRQNFGLPQHLPIETYGYVLLVAIA